MIKKFLTLFFFLLLIITASKSVWAQSPTSEINHPTQNYLKAEVIKIISSEIDNKSEFGIFKQIL